MSLKHTKKILRQLYHMGIELQHVDTERAKRMDGRTRWTDMNYRSTKRSKKRETKMIYKISNYHVV